MHPIADATFPLKLLQFLQLSNHIESIIHYVFIFLIDS